MPVDDSGLDAEPILDELLSDARGVASRADCDKLRSLRRLRGVLERCAIADVLTDELTQAPDVAAWSAKLNWSPRRAS